MIAEPKQRKQYQKTIVELNRCLRVLCPFCGGSGFEKTRHSLVGKYSSSLYDECKYCKGTGKWESY